MKTFKRIFNYISLDPRLIILCSFLWTISVTIIITNFIIPNFDEANIKSFVLNKPEHTKNLNSGIIFPDASSYSNEAIEFSEKLSIEGIENWTMFSKGCGRDCNDPIANLLALFYYFTNDNLFSFFIFNCIIFSLSVYFLYRIYNEIFKDKKASLICLLPFLFFPTAISFYANISKDNFFIFGVLANLYSLLIIIKIFSNNIIFKKLIFMILNFLMLYIIGLSAMLIFRGYFLEIIIVPLNLIFIIILIIALINYKKKYFIFKMFSYILFMSLIKIIFVANLADQDTFKKSISFYVPFIFYEKIFVGTYSEGDYGNLHNNLKFNHIIKIFHLNREEIQENIETPINSKINQNTEDEINNEIKSTNNQDVFEKSFQWSEVSLKWENVSNNKFITKLESKLRAIAVYRKSFLDSGGNTLIFENFHLRNSIDIAKFFPLALITSFLTPLPDSWVEIKSNIVSTLMTKINGIEMIFIYISILFLILNFKKCFLRINFVISSIYFLPILLLFGYTIPNLGTLIRFRYGFLMFFVGIGFYYLINYFLTKKYK